MSVPDPVAEPPVAEPTVGMPDDEPVLEAAPVWKETSARIHVETRSYWLGGMRYERAAEDLTEEQLELLGGLERAESDKNFCIYDALEATVTIFDVDGSSETFEMEQGICYYDGPLLTHASLKPFLNTLACLTRGAFGLPGEVQDVPEDETPVVVANDGCIHGLYESPPWVMLDVTDTSLTYTIESLDCEHSDVHIDLFDESRETLLASGVAGPEAGCSTLSYEFATTGAYALHIEGAGEYSLRVSAE